MSSSKKASPQTEIAKDAFKRIQVAINAAPLIDIAKIVDPDIDIDFDLSSDRVEAEDAIEGLADIAQLGNLTAIQHLAYLGCKIARILANLTDTPVSSVNKKTQNPNTPHTDQIAQDTRATNFSDDVNVLASCDESSLESTLAKLDARVPTARFSIELDELCALLAPCLGGSSLVSTIISESNKRLVELICQSLIAYRLTKELPAVALTAARSVAAESWGWPIEVSAVADKRSETISDYIKFLGLGSKIPANLDTRDGKGTGKLGTKRDFSILVFDKLNAERKRMMIPRSRSHEKELLDAENRASAETDHQTVTDPYLRMTTWHIENYWKRKAALLPEFTQEAESQKKWHEAAMAFADSMCMGDFEKKIWPEVIIDRTTVNTKNPHPRSTKSAVSEVLKSGLLALAKKRKP